MFKPILAIVCFASWVRCGTEVGFVDHVTTERRDETLVQKNIPDWIEGFFLQQVCGGIGPYGKQVAGTYVQHMYDCMGMVSSFAFLKSKILYSNKYYRTRQYEIFKNNTEDMSKSKIAWNTLYTNIDANQYSKYQRDYSTFPFINPTIGFNKIGSRIEAVSDMHPNGYNFMPDSLEMLGWFPYPDKDAPLGFARGSFFINHPPHSMTDSTGIRWSSVLVIQPKYNGILFTAQRVVYKIYPNATRVLIGSLKLKDINTQYCTPTSSPSNSYIYTDTVSYSELAYMHSVAQTDKYVVLPTSSYFLNPCFLKTTQMAKPIMSAWYSYRKISEKFLPKFLIMEKATGTFKQVNLQHETIVSHVLNAYDKDSNVIMDVMTHNSAYPDTYLTIKNILTNWPMDTNIRRYTLSTTASQPSWIYLTSQQAIAANFPSINPAYSMKSTYNYFYMVENPYSENSRLSKYDISTSTRLPPKVWNPGSGFYVGAPAFVPKPTGATEDDGVLITLVLDSYNKKSAIYVIDAKTMIELGRAEAPEAIPYGLHSLFVSRKELSLSSGMTILSSVITISVCLFVISL